MTDKRTVLVEFIFRTTAVEVSVYLHSHFFLFLLLLVFTCGQTRHYPEQAVRLYSCSPCTDRHWLSDLKL